MALENKFRMKLCVKDTLNKFIPTITANDNTVFEFEIFNGAERVELLDTYRYIFVTKAIGKDSVMRDVFLNTEGLVEVVLGYSETKYPGTVDCALQIYDKNNKRISTPRVKVNIKGDLALMGGLPAEDSKLVIADEAQLTRAVSAADEIEVSKTKFNTLSERLEHDKAELLTEIDSVTARLVAVEINVKMFGAVGDGKTDDTFAIQSAIDYCVANKYTLKIPEGVFMIKATSSSTLFPQGLYGGGIQIRGSLYLSMDEQAELKAITGNKIGYTVLGITGAENVVIDGGIITGERDTHEGTEGEFGMGISVIDSRNVIIKNTKISNCWGDGIYINTHSSVENLTDGVLIDNVVSDRNRRLGLSILASKNVKVTNSTFSNTSGTFPCYGIDIEADMISKAFNISITNCTFISNENGGVVFGGGWGCEGVTVSNNQFINTGQAITITGHEDNMAIDAIVSGNIVTDSGGVGIGITEGKNLIISNNVLRSTVPGTGYGIYLTNPINVAFISNVVSNYQFGVVFENDGATTPQFISNIFKDNKRALTTNVSVTGLEFSSNTIDGGDYTAFNVTATNSVIINNTFRNTKSSALTGKFDGCVISNNTFRNIGYSDPASHPIIRMDVIDGNFITGNYFIGSNAEQYSIYSTATSISPSVVSNNFARYKTDPFFVDNSNILTNNSTAQL